MNKFDNLWQQHGWQIITILAGFIITFTILQTKVNAIEEQVDYNSNQVINIAVINSQLSEMNRRLEKIEESQEKIYNLILNETQ